MKNLLGIFSKVSKKFSTQVELSAEPPHWLEILGKEFGCEWATYWKVNPKTHLLDPVANWRSGNVPTEKLARDTHPLSLSEGNAGLVWRSQTPIWSSDLVSEMCIPRSIHANSVGLVTGIWFAVKTDQRIYGVIEMLGKEYPPKSQELLQAAEKLGVDIGKRLSQPKKVDSKSVAQTEAETSSFLPSRR